jgi:hypothetical protein
MSENPPAFPVICENGLGHVSDGMTLRDWFAGEALAGEMASQSVETGEWSNTATDRYLIDRARLLYRFADAMLVARAIDGAA